MKRAAAASLTFLTGGFIYCCIELLYRGYTTASMFILAGCCALIMTGLNNIFSYDFPFIYQVLISSFFCILGEFVTGILLNSNYTIWDYRNLPYTFAYGQLNLFFCLAWVVLSIIGIPLLDYVQWKFLKDETKPYYIIFGKKIYLY